MTILPKHQVKGAVIAGLRGGSGKSVAAVGITAALARRGRKIAPFKKGPDYIDAGWLALAAGNPCRNLDPYLMDGATMKHSCLEAAQDCEYVIVEGNRGLFDGVDVKGSYSSAELAILLDLPVFLTIDCTKATRTVAALVLGCLQFEPRLKLAGVILNRIGSRRHEKLVRESVEHYTGVPVIGAMPRLGHDVFPQRHIGITPLPEYEGAAEAIDALVDLMNDCVDLDRFERRMGSVELQAEPAQLPSPVSPKNRYKIGVIKDAAFQFYYPENIAALTASGAEIVELNALTAPVLPELDGLYIGGGFPETSVRLLAANVAFKNSLRSAIENGLPVYAECGGLIYLGESLTVDGESHELSGVFPVHFVMEKKPQAHGYTHLSTTAANPFYPQGFDFKGHEFRYSRVASWSGNPAELAFTMKRGVGFIDGRDGLVYKNVLALYTHIHALATPEWTDAFMGRVRAERLRSG